MSLLYDAFEDFTILNKAVVDDGYGGTDVVWTPGATIQGAMTFDSSVQMKIALASGAKGAYTFTVRRKHELDFHTVVQRESDKAIFRLISNSDDKKTPRSAGLDMRQYSAEEYKLPTKEQA